MMRAHFPVLDHLRILTDDVGVIQHATYDVPNRSTGYCTDDVARALIVAVEADETKLISTYLAFLHDAQLSDGWFHNFLGYDRQWQDRRGSPDAVGRAIWALGHTVRFARRESWRRLAARMLERALPFAADLGDHRPRAYAVLGLAHAAKASPLERAPLEAAIAANLAGLLAAFEREHGPQWVWCEAMMTYDNARLCEALMCGGAVLGDRRAIETGRRMFDFLAAVTVEGEIFAPVGSDGWYPRDGVKARFGQQPIEAAGMVDAAIAAGSVNIAEIAYRWFFGRNSAHAMLVTGGGCRDGIDADGPNANMGAESTISYLLAGAALAREAGERLPLAR